MTPRDRVLAALRGEEVFPIPVDVTENLIWPKLEADLIHHFNLTPGDHEGVLRALGAHLRWGKPAYAGPPLEIAPFQPPETFPAPRATRSIWGSWAGMNTYSDEIERPLRDAESIHDIERHRWPDPDWFDYSRLAYFPNEDYRPVAEWADRHADYARVVGGFDPIFCRVMDLCGMERGLWLMAARPDLVEAIVARVTDFLEEYYRRIAEAGRGSIDILGFGDDFAGQQGMLLSPDLWRRLFLPSWKRLFAVAHRHGMKAMMHSCGGVRAVLGDLIDAGLDIFEVVQVTAAGMEPAALKRDFGADLTFYGGLDTQRLLPQGSPDEVRAEVRRLGEVLGQGGRYILASMHLMMNDVPPENALALYDEARSYVPALSSAE